MCFSFSKKKKIDKLKAQEGALKLVEHSIKVQLETFVSHLQTVQMSYDNIQRQNEEILRLLKEKKKNGQ